MEKVNEDASLEFKWLKKRGVGGKKKEVRFYGSFIYDGVEYVLYDCVYMYKEGLQEPYIGKLTKIWENADKTKKVKVHWFFRPEEISKWLGDTKTLEKEIFFASGEGVGLANISPLEAIAGKCNVVCVSKDSRNPQPSDDELKAADFIFYRTFDVESCTILDTMDEKIGGIEIKDIFNRREDETTSDKKEENEKPNTITCGEPQQHLTKTLLPNNLEDDKKDASHLEKTNSKKDEKADKDEKGDDCATVAANKMEANKRKKTDNLHDQPSKKLKLDDKNPPKEKQLQLEDAERLTNTPSKKSQVDNLHDQSSKILKLDDKNPPKEKQLQLEDSERLTDTPSKKSKVDNSIKSPVVNHVNNVTAGKNSEIGKKTDKDNLKVLSKDKDEAKVGKVSTVDKERKKIPVESDKLDDRPLKKMKSPTNEKQGEEGGDIIEKLTDLPSKKSKVDSKAKENDKGKNVDELEGRTLKKTKGEGSFKIPDNKKNSTVINTKGINGKNEGKLKSAVAVDSVVGSNNNNKEDQSNVSKKKLSVSKSSKDLYQEFVISPKPNADRNGWFKRPTWEESLKNAYDQGTAILLHNMDPDYTSSQVEDIIWHAFNEYCEAKILPCTAISTPHSYRALVLLKTKEAAHKILAKLDEDCLMLSNGRPLVGTPCPPIIPRKNCKFFGHLVIDRIKITQREEEAVSTSHFSQPNTIEYEMAMDWLLLQSKSKKWWEMINKVQGTELKKLEAKFVKK